MESFEINGLGQLDETTSWLERTLAMERSVAARTLKEIVAELRDASTNIRQEIQEGGWWMSMQEHVRALLNRQEVLEETVKSAEQERDVYRDQISQLSIELRIAQQARDEVQRCYNAHDQLLNEKDAELERLRQQNRQLEDEMVVLREALREHLEERDDWRNGRGRCGRHTCDLREQLEAAQAELERLWQERELEKGHQDSSDTRSKLSVDEQIKAFNDRFGPEEFNSSDDEE